jgi:beta-glucosidase
MPRLPRRRALAVALAGAITPILLATSTVSTASNHARSANAAQPADPAQPWRNPNQPAMTRANELLAVLSTDQRISIALNDFSTVSALGVPALSWDDGPDGIRASGTTAMPSAQALASTFDRRLAYQYGQVIGAEARAKGFNWWLGPAMDIARTPLAGRQPENQGEDPFLAGHTSAAEVLGAKDQNVIATLKHYVGNNQEWQRTGFQSGPNPSVHGDPVNDLVSERALQEIYEAPFRTAVRLGGADAVMCSYNRVNGLQTCQSPAVLGDLKNGIGLTGLVVPDFGFAVRDPLAATLAGVDIPALTGAGGRTAAMFTSGQVSPARLDDIVRRTLFAIFDSGAFDNPLPTPGDQVSTPAHHAAATRIAEAGMVLLQNEHHVLPLSGRTRSIALIGPTGEDAKFTTGGSAAVPVVPGQAITPAQAITARAGSGSTVTPVQGSAGDTPAATIVPSSALSPSSGTGPGISARYWTGGDFSGTPVLTRVDPTIDLSAGPSQAGSPWSARWTGTLTPPETGLYRFSLLESGIATLTIAGHKFGPAYREATQFVAGPSYSLQGAVELKAGRSVPIEIDYSSKSGLFSQEIHFAWQPPSASGIPAAVAAARKADVAIVFANDTQGEGMDRTTLSLPGDQNHLIEAVAAANRRTIVVLNTGGPVLMPWLHDVDGVLEAWYPGQQFGAAIAAVLFGDADPAGRLPVTFPASDRQGPAPASQPEHYPGVNGNEHYDEGLDVGYRWYDATGQRPLFPFGYGLSYGQFDISGARASFHPFSRTATIITRVRNTSHRPGPVTIELYLASPPGAQEPPKQLRGYRKLELAAGQSALASFRLGPSDLAYFDASASRWRIAPGRYTALVGTTSTELRPASFFIPGS